MADLFDEFQIGGQPQSTGTDLLSEFGIDHKPQAIGVVGTLKEGAKSAARAIGSTVNTYTGDNQGVVEKAEAQHAAVKAPELQRFYDDVQRNKEDDAPDAGLWEGIKNVGGAIIDNPKGAGLAVVEQLPNAVPTLAGGYAGMKAGAAVGAAAGAPFAGVGAAPGALAGSIIGGLTGMFLGNAAIETGHKAMEAAGDGEFTADEASQVKQEGAIKAGVITAIDGLTLGLGGKVASSMQRTATSALESATRKTLIDNGVDVGNAAAVAAAKQNPAISKAVRESQDAALKVADTFKRRAAEAGTLLGMETVGEGLGEYLGELAATGEADVTDAVMEAALSLGQSSVEAAWNMSRTRQHNRWAPADDAIQPMPTAEDPNPAPVARPDPNAGVISRTANLLPAPQRLALPGAGPTLYVDSEGQISQEGAARNVDREFRPVPGREPRMGGGPGMDQQTERGINPLIGELIPAPRAAAEPANGLMATETIDARPEVAGIPDLRPRGFIVDSQGRAESGRVSNLQPVEAEPVSGLTEQAQKVQRPTFDQVLEQARSSKGLDAAELIKRTGASRAQAARAVSAIANERTVLGSTYKGMPGANKARKSLLNPDAFEVVKGAEPKTFRIQAKAPAEQGAPAAKGSGPVLQNRDRSTAASVTQMRSIAANPDYSRLGFSRDFANGAPVVEPGAQVPKERLGRQDVAVTSSGRRIPVQYAAVEATDLLGSHDANGSPIQDYASGMKGKSRAIAGNGRVAGLRQAFAQGTAAEYVELLAGDSALHGIDPAAIKAMKEPVLVRVMPSEEVTENIGDESNTSGVSALSGAEQAINDARRINIDGLEFSENGELTEAAVRQFVRAMPAAEQGGLLDGSRPSRQAFDRAESAVFAHAYESETLIRLQAQATDAEARTVMSGLLIAAPRMAKLKDAGAWDVRGIVVEAAEAAINARRNGQSLADYAAQADLERNPEAQPILEMFASNARSGKRIGEELSNLADLFYIEASKAETDIFGAVPRRSRSELLGGSDASTESGTANSQDTGNAAGPESAARGNEGTVAQSGQPASLESDQDFSLTQQTEQELSEQAAAQAAAERAEAEQARAEQQRAQADKDRNDFTLTGSDRTADVAAARGQNDMFGVRPAVKAEPASIAGKDIDGDWMLFSDKSGSLKIPRAEMPQIKAEHRGAMVNFLNARDIAHAEETIAATDLKPTQAEFSRKKVEAAMQFTGGDRSILISSDGHVLDGHHQWMARRDAGEDVKVIRLDAPIAELLEVVAEFPSAGVDQASEGGASQISAKDKSPTIAEPKAEKPAANQTKKTPTANAPIEDAGEKLGGARKDQLLSVRDRLESMDDEAIASSTLSQLWPKGEVDRIEDPLHAAFYHYVRGHIPNKPRVSYRLKAWVSKVKAAREMIAYLGSLGADVTLTKMRESGSVLRAGADHIEVLTAVDRSQWGRIDSVQRETGRYNHDGEMVPGSWVKVGIDGYKVNFYGHETVASALPSIKARLENKAAPEKKMKFSIYTRRADGGVFISKDGDSEYRSLKEFADVKAARAFIDDHHDQLVSAWDAVKNRDNVTKADMRRSTNDRRVGQDHRSGQDITAEQFLESFGFRGVEFGNWVKQGVGGRDRQGMLNEAYDAFMDLAGILNVPPKALSLEGKLGIGFGSRGAGKASAHFEPDNVVINLTKTKGAGSLAHEWFHALDNYFARRRADQSGTKITDRENAYVTYRPEAMFINKKSSRLRMTRAEIQRYQKNHPSAPLYKDENWERDPAHPQGIRPEVEKAFAELVATLNDSPMLGRSKVIDGKTADGYWSRIIERGARSFETYTIARLADRGHRNDYLANVQTLEQFARDPGRYPYLTPDEQGPVNEAFDKLFATIETRETDSGVAMFSRDRSRSGGSILEHDAVKAIVERVNARLGLSLPVRIHRSESDLFTAVPEIGRQAENDGANGQINAVYHNGTVHVVTNAFVRRFDVELAIVDALAHEGQGHYGIRSLFNGDRVAIDAALREFFSSIGGVIGVRRLAAKHGIENIDLYLETARGMTANQRAGYLADELLAHLQGKAATAGLAARVKAAMQAYIGAVRDWLRQHGFSNLAKGTDADIAWLLKRMREAAKVSPDGQVSAPRFVRSDQVSSPAFKKWFGDSKVVDAEGKAQVLYHGTAEDFTIFDQSRSGNSTGHATSPLGIFMTSNRELAEGYARNASDGMPGLANVMHLFASISNPYTMTVEESQSLDTPLKARRRRSELEQAGHDGIRLKGTDVWVAFNNYQVKSATNNTGAFDEFDPDIRFSRSSSAADREALEALGLGSADAKSVLEKITSFTRDDFKKLMSDWGRRAEEGLFDGLLGIKRAEEAVGVTDPNQQGYVSARLATGIADVMHSVMRFGAPQWKDGVIQHKEGTRGLLEVLAELGPNNLNTWLGWLGAKRGQLLKAQGLENNLTDAEISELLAGAAGKEELFERVYREYAQINEAVLDLAQEAGLVDAESRKRWATDYYVPFYRELEGENMFSGPRTSRGLSHQTAAIRALKGGNTATKDLLTNILQGWSKRIDASMKNKAMLEVVENLKDSEFLSDESSRFQQISVSRSQIAQHIRKDRKALKQAANMLGLKESANFLQVSSELMKPSNEGFEKLWVQVAPTDPDIIRVQRDGKNEYYRVNDESLLRGLKAMGGTVFTDPVTTLGRKAKQLLTTGVTASPDFILRNFIRDGAHAWVINPDGFKLFTDSMKGINQAFKEDPHYRAMSFAGASFQGGYIHGGDPEAAAQMVRRALGEKGLNAKQQDAYMDSLANSPAKMAAMLRTGWEKYRGVSDKVENANRLATYKRALAAGKSERQAAFESKDLMDFSMRGNFIAAQWFTDVVPFLNARMQGLYKLGRAAKGDKAMLARHVAMKGSYLALFTLALAALNGDDERYKDLPDWDKDLNWHVFLGEAHFRIPKPFELGLVFGTIPERLFHAVLGDQDSGDLGRAVAHGVFETLGFNPVPQLVHPIRELQANRNFFRDAPIEDMSDEGKLPEARYDERTSAFSKAAGQVTGPVLGVSPKQLDHLIRGYLGTMGGYALSMSNVIAGIGNDAESPDFTAADVPLVKVLYSGDAVRSSRYQAEFYDMLTEADQLHRTIKGYREEGRVELAESLLRDNAAKVRHRPALGLARKQLGNIRNQMDAVHRDKAMSGAEKRERLNELQRRANSVAERVVRLAGEDF